MGQDAANVNLVSILMYCADQSNFVAANIKHREFLNLVGVRKSLAQLREILKTAFRIIVYQRARADLAPGCFSANS